MRRELEPGGIDASSVALLYEDLVKLPVEDLLISCMALSVLSLGRTKGKILDVGVGSAILPIKIAEQSPRFHITGVDVSRSMLERGRENVRRQGRQQQVDLVLGDGTGLDYPDAHFDIVYSNHTLHHLHDPVELLSEANRVAKPDGGILIRDIRRPPTDNIVDSYVARFGNDYNHAQRQLYRQSLKAGLTLHELRSAGQVAGIRDFTVQKNYLTHISLVKFAKPFCSPTRALAYPQGKDELTRTIIEQHVVSR